MQENRTAYLLLVFLCIFLMGCSKGSAISTGVAEVSEASVEIMSEENTTTENTTEESTTEKNTEEKKKEAFRVLNEQLITVRDMLLVTEPEKTVLDFLNWFVEEYGEDILFEIYEYVEKGEYSDALFHRFTGNSIYILTDSFLKNREYATLITKTGREDEAVNLMIAGDICLEEDGFVLDYFDETGVLSDYISPILLEKNNKADIFLINHEYSSSLRGEPLNGKYYTFRAKPERVSILKEMGTDIVSLANNHVYDYGAEAFMDTLRVLDKGGIPYVGGGSNYEEASKPVFFMVNGVKIGYVAASRAEKNRFTPEATEDSPGIVLMYDLNNIKDIISRASKQCDYLVAYLHWGTEDSRYFEQYQHDIAKELFDCGADIIIGSHPHVLQGMEYIDGKPVVYSLGDFWFNGETKYTGMLSLKINIEGLQKMEFIPCIQSGYKTTYIEAEEEQGRLFEYLQQLSKNLTIDSFGIITSTITSK